MSKRKPKRPTVRGLGAARMSHLRKVLRERRAASAKNFIEHCLTAIRAGAAFGYDKNHWTVLPIVQAARRRYLSALASDLYQVAA
jgi:hypothetical protein